MEHWYAPSVPDELLPVNHALVLAPHPDDEVFGCGGLLAKYRKLGTLVDVLILSDGAGMLPAEHRNKVMALRCAESNHALAILGVPPAHCSAFPDRELASQGTMPELIVQRVLDGPVDLLLLPSLWEIHPDHLAVARAGLLACERLVRAGSRPPNVMFYEIGAPQRINALVDISDVWSLKEKAMACFESQLKQQNYARHISALNTYRTYTLPDSVQYAEGFYKVSSGELAEMLAAGVDLAGRMMGRWIESALAAADIETMALQAQLREAVQKIELLTVREGYLQTRLREIENSRSWRWTAALRRG